MIGDLIQVLRVMVNEETLDAHVNDKVEMYVNDEPLVISGDSRYYSTARTDIIMFGDDRKVLVHVKKSKFIIEFTGNYVRIALDVGNGGLCYV